MHGKMMGDGMSSIMMHGEGQKMKCCRYSCRNECRDYSQMETNMSQGEKCCEETRDSCEMPKSKHN
jgi:hypothetical protein